MPDLNNKFQKLREPFLPHDIEWRVQRARVDKNTGKIKAVVLAYVTARAVQNRLDEVFGAENWWADYKFIDHEKNDQTGVICNLTLVCDGEAITKVDGATETQVEAFKGGISSAFKRAASVWGIGRYLYGLEETTITEDPNGSHLGLYQDKRSGEKRWFRWNSPPLPKGALPQVNENEPSKAVVGKDDEASTAKAKAPQQSKNTKKKLWEEIQKKGRSNSWTNKEFKQMLDEYYFVKSPSELDEKQLKDFLKKVQLSGMNPNAILSWEQAKGKKTNQKEKFQLKEQTK